MTLGERLRDLRVNGPAGYRTLRQVAAAMGVSPAKWSGIETDRERPSLNVLSMAAPYLQGSLGELLRLRDEWQEAPAPDLGRSICHKVWT